MNEATQEAARLIHKTQKQNMEIALENKVLSRKAENLWQTLCGLRNLLGDSMSEELRAEVNKVLTNNNPSNNEPI